MNQSINLTSSISRQWVQILSLCCLLMVLALPASASHFRGGGISWQAVELDGDGLANDIEVTIKTAWALNGQNSISSLSATPALSFVQDSEIVVNIGTEYTQQTTILTSKDLDLNTQYDLVYSGGARIGSLVNNSNGNWKIQSKVYLKAGNLAPKIELPIIFEVPQQKADTTPLTSFSFKIGASDPNADKLKFRLANADETQGTQPTGFSIDQNTGLLTWVGSGALNAGLYSVGLIVEDTDFTGAVKSKSHVDFIFGLADKPAAVYTQPANVPSNNTVRVDKGSTFTFNINGPNIESTSLGSIQGALTESGSTEGEYTFDPGVTGTGLNPATYPMTFVIEDTVDDKTKNYMVVNFIVVDPNAPKIINLDQDSTTYNGAADHVVDDGVDVLVTDANDTDLNGGNVKLNVTFTDGQFEILKAKSVGDGVGEIRVTGSDVFYEGDQIGVIDSIFNGEGKAFQVNFTTSDATLAAVQALIRNLTYADGFLLRSSGVRNLSVFIKDGSGLSNSYDLYVDVQDHPDKGTAGTGPLLASNSLTIPDGATVVLSSTELHYADVDTAAGGITLTASNISNGQFELTTNVGVGVTSFTQEQVDQGLVQFVHSGSGLPPSYDIVATDGVTPAAPSTVSVFFSVASTSSATVVEHTTTVSTISSSATGGGETYSIIGGDDAAKFSINGSGDLVFSSAPDGETATDSDVNNIYLVDVRITDGSVNDIQTVTVTIQDVNEFTPTITSDGGNATAAISIVEGNTAVTTVVATDEDFDNSAMAYSLSGGADQALFNISAAGGELTFASAPNFGSPNANNTYFVEVTATADADTDVQMITVTVDEDSDGDGIPNGIDADPNDACNPSNIVSACDSDGDGVPDGTDANVADPCVPSDNASACDADNDGTPDGTDGDDADPCVPSNNSAACDTDNDGTPDGTDPAPADGCLPNNTVSVCDSDGDGIPNGTEISNGTNPNKIDTDGDGRPDNADSNATNACIPNNTILACDSDGDGIPDGKEIESGTNPNERDTDADGEPDNIDSDANNACLPSNMVSACDSDKDGISDGAESANGTNPNDSDTDGDGVPDNIDLDANDACLPSNTVSACDSDGDGIPNAVEIEKGTNPNESDTDGDGEPDNIDSDANNACLPSNIVSACDSDEDGIPDGVEIEKGTDPNNSDTDGDGVLDGTDLDASNTCLPSNMVSACDSDEDGISDGIEIEQGTNPNDNDTDGDGAPDGIEQENGSDPFKDDIPPVIDGPDDITLDAVGLFTEVTIEQLGVALAIDGLDGEVTPTSNVKSHYPPGVHTVIWTAIDTAGNEVNIEQNINIIPLVGFSKDQTVSENSGDVSFKVILNGDAVNYPVSVPYSVSGTAESGSDHNLQSGTVIIESGHESTVVFSIIDDGLSGEALEVIDIVMDTPTHAVIGPKKQHQVRIIEGNVAPVVSLKTTQDNVQTRIVSQGDTPVRVESIVQDSNPNDEHTYVWQSSDLMDTDSADETFTFLPSDIGRYTLQVSVMDNGSPIAENTTSITLNVVSAQPILGDSDSDHDGIDDATEGFGDADNDGIADFLDDLNASDNVLPEHAGEFSEFVIESEPGLSLSLGVSAFELNNGKASLTEDELSTTGDGIVSDDEYDFGSGLFDFVVDNIPDTGLSVDIVVPQFVQIPTNAVYRKLMDTGWQNFVEDANNRVASAPGTEGFCPPPGDIAYISGLTEGHWCVQLTIEDGGPNDADNTADNRITDPGGVAQLVGAATTPTTPPAPPTTPTGSNSKVHSSSGGSIGLGMLSMLCILGLLRVRKVRCSVLPLILVSSSATLLLPQQNSYAFDWQQVSKKGFVEFEMFSAKGDQTRRDFTKGMAKSGVNVSTSDYDVDRIAYQLSVGYTHNPYATFLVAYTHLGDAKVQFETAETNKKKIKKALEKHHPLSGDGLSFTYRYQRSLMEKVNAFIEAGVLIWRNNVDTVGAGIHPDIDGGIDPVFALGLNYALTEKTQIGLKYRHQTLDDQSLSGLGVLIKRDF